MKMIIYFLLSAVILLAGCNNVSGESDVNGTANLTVSFVCSESENVDMNTRVLNPQQEKNIRDLNIYMYHRATGICKRQYLSGAMSFSMPLNLGQWDIYVIGNYGFDMGNKTKAEIENLRYTISSETDLERNSVMPMSAYKEVNVAGNSSISITLKRIVAKIDVSVNLLGAAIGNITLHSATLVNAPSTSGYFGTNSPYSGMISYTEQTVSNRQNMSFYMLENRQGVNNSISHQRYKSKINAPANATYLHIKGQTDNALLDYLIYLGENNTTDFNVIANRKYSIIINIQGVNETDWRVEVTQGKTIGVMITKAERSVVEYYSNLSFIRSDNTFDVSVSLTEPSRYPLKIKIAGVFNLYGSRTQLAEKDFFTSTVVTIPAGQTENSARFIRQLMPSGHGIPKIQYNECIISGIQTEPLDINDYMVFNEYFEVLTVKDEVAGQ